MDFQGRLAEHAPAKINLALHVTGRRADGYHDIESLVVFAKLGDRLSVELASVDDLAITGPFARDIPADGGNLVMRARDALRAAFPGHAALPVAITLEKNLPVASGIGGGSSDAAAALRALARLWCLPANPAATAKLALALGADVPMCLVSQPLVARGVGERVEPVAGLPPLPLVLVNPGIAVATPDVFRALTHRENPPLPPLPVKSDRATIVGWLSAARNDLEAPARQIAPSVGDALESLRANGARLARMSGSGATCFGIFDTPDSASNAARAIAAGNPGWFVADTSST